MRIYVIRHAEPEDGGDYEDNDDPSLTDDGKDAATALGKWMADKEEIPTVLYASPKTRTQETAEAISQAIGDAGFAAPEVVTDVSIGPHMSIKGLVERVKDDDAQVRVGIVSHHESIEHGLRVLNLEPWIHLDILAMCECRILKVKRKSGEWEEHRRVSPSDLGGVDMY